MTIKVHNVIAPGEFLTGNIDFFTITSIVPCDNTDVSMPLDRLKSDLRIGSDDISTVGGFVVAGITYADDAAYSFGFDKQSNLNQLLQIVSQKATPIMINSVDLGNQNDVDDAIPAGSTNAAFGSTYSGNAGTVYSIKFATEHEDVWETQDILSQDIDGFEILDSSAIITDPDRFNTSDSSLLNTVILKNNFL